MKNLLVIGGSKFIGKRLLKKLADQDCKITVLNRGTTPNEKYLPSNATHFVVDRNDMDKLNEILKDKEFDIVYDIACITGEHAGIIIDVLRGKVKRHVHISSGSIYQLEKPSDITEIPVPEDHPFASIYEDTHPYVKAKTEAELAFFKVFEEEGYPVSIVRPTFVYGPDNYVYREAYFFDRISRGRTLLLPENGEGYFDMIYVDDLVDLIIHIGTYPDDKVLGQAYNGSSSKLLSANMFTRQVAQILDKEVKIEYYPLTIREDLSWPPEKMLYPYPPSGTMSFSNAKVERDTGFIVKTSYEKGLTNAYNWWKNEDHDEPDWEIEDLLIEYLKLIKGKSKDDTAVLKLKGDIIYKNSTAREETN
jgi:nucleoside-diphosphate-sugar epimerase